MQSTLTGPDSKGPRMCIVIMGPKGAGKSWVADVLVRHCGVHHVDPDVVILELLARRESPEAHTGWLASVEAALDEAMRHHERVSTEATGAWDSDWRLIGDLRARGVVVRTVWVQARFEATLTRLDSRVGPKVPVTPEEAAWTFREATHRARGATFDLVIDSNGGLDETTVVAMARPLFAERA